MAEGRFGQGEFGWVRQAGIAVAGILVALIVVTGSFFTVDAGERAVVLRFGAISSVRAEGIHMKIPLVDAVIKIDVRIQKAITKTESSSKDLQIVTSEIALNYHLDGAQVGDIYRQIGMAWETRIIDPAVRETVKAVTAQYTAEKLITQRSDVSNAIKNLLAQSLSAYGLIVDEVSITDFDFSQEFNKAIEAKQTAEQMALKAQRDLDRIRIEADQKIAAARAEAESLRIQREVVSEQLIRLREIEVQRLAVEKWNGVMPTVTGGALPFINVK